MKITIQSTTKIVELNGVPARIWEGVTEDGIELHCYVTRVAVAEGQDTKQFEAQLQQHKAPIPEVEAIPLKMII